MGTRKMLRKLDEMREGHLEWTNTSILFKMVIVIFLIIIILTTKTLICGEHIINSKYSITCEVDMITQYLQQILGYNFELKVCLVSKLLIHVVFSLVQFSLLRFTNIQHKNMYKKVPHRQEKKQGMPQLTFVLLIKITIFIKNI